MSRKNGIHTTIKPVEQLVRRSDAAIIIQDLVNDILKNVEEAAQQAVDARRNFAEISLPTVFEVAPLSNKNSQLRIYYHVLVTLEQAGYDPKIRFVNGSKQEVYIRVHIKNRRDNEEDAYMDNYIRLHTS